MELNSRFEHLREVIELGISDDWKAIVKLWEMNECSHPDNIEPNEWYDYDKGPFKIVKDMMQSHIDNYLSPISQKESSIVIMHPYFVFLHDSNILKKDVAEDAKKYVSLLEKRIVDFKESGSNVVILENLFDYPYQTSRLVENGMVDAVYFTAFNDGDFSSKVDLGSNNLYIAGGYHRGCLDDLTWFAKRTNCTYSLERDLIVINPSLTRKIFFNYSPSGKFIEV